MSISSMPVATGFLATPFSRLVGAIAGWFVFTLSFTLLVRCFVDVAAVGGYCASGNSAYVIQTQCPAGADLFLPWVIFTGLIGVFGGFFLSRGFGFPLIAWAWTLLFCILGAGFLLEGIFAADATGWIIGILFEIMGLVPLVISLRASAQRVFIGQQNLAGETFAEGPRARGSLMLRDAPVREGGAPVRAGDVIVALAVGILPAWAGAYVGLLWYAAVAS